MKKIIFFILANCFMIQNVFAVEGNVKSLKVLSAEKLRDSHSITELREIVENKDLPKEILTIIIDRVVVVDTAVLLHRSSISEVEKMQKYGLSFSKEPSEAAKEKIRTMIRKDLLKKKLREVNQALDVANCMHLYTSRLVWDAWFERHRELGIERKSSEQWSLPHRFEELISSIKSGIEHRYLCVRDIGGKSMLFKKDCVSITELMQISDEHRKALASFQHGLL